MLETTRTIIRPYTTSDIERILPILSDPETMKFWPQPFAPEKVERWVNANIKRAESGQFGRMIVEGKERGEVLGDCGIMQVEINGRPENDLGYIIHSPFQGMGFGTECAQAILNSLSTRGTQNSFRRRVVANMPFDHIASRRVAEKIGMKMETTFHNEQNRNIKTCLYVAFV